MVRLLAVNALSSDLLKQHWTTRILYLIGEDFVKTVLQLASFKQAG